MDSKHTTVLTAELMYDSDLRHCRHTHTPADLPGQSHWPCIMCTIDLLDWLTVLSALQLHACFVVTLTALHFEADSGSSYLLGFF